MEPHSLQQQFSQFIQEAALFGPKERLLVAVSGGLDSAVLCHLCHSALFSFFIAHCNFGLRGAESDRDEAFVRQLGQQYNVPVLVRCFDTAHFAQQQKLSMQEAARKLRYDWFGELVSNDKGKGKSFNETQTPASGPAAELQRGDWIVTAHHLDDDVETAIMNFFKGSGISGLRGMLHRQGRVVRPLLFARRSQLEAYARAAGLQWVEDSSNGETKYTRNFLRHEVLPLISEKVPGALDNVARSLPRLKDAELLYRQAVAQHQKKLLVQKGAEVHIPVLKLLQSQPLHTIVYEIMKPFGFAPGQTAPIVQLLHSETGKYLRSATHQVVRHRRWLVIAPLQEAKQSLLVVEREEKQVHYEGGVLQLSEVPFFKNLATGPETALLDGGTVQFPLVLRRWKAGDYFYPLGMPKKKKVSRLLIDLKLSKTQKEAVWVLESGKRIAWVVGLRLDDRFKVTPATKTILRVTSIPSTPGKAAPRE